MKTLIILFMILISVGLASENNLTKSDIHTIYFEKIFNKKVASPLSNSIESGQYTYAVGSISTNNHLNYDTEQPFVVKFDQKGNILWSKTFIDYFGRLDSIVTDKNFNIYAVGTEYSATRPGYNDIQKSLIIKLDSNGNVLWKKTIGTTKYDSFKDIKIMNNNLYIIGLTRYKNIKYQSELVKMNTNGKILFSKIIYDDYYVGFEPHIEIDIDENIYVSNNSKSKKPSITKYDKDGKKLFTKEINSFGLLQVVLDDNNNLYTISIDKKPALATNIMKLNSNGSIIWEKNIKIDKRNFPKNIVVNNDRIYILGRHITIYDLDGLYKSKIQMKQVHITNIVPTKDKGLFITGGKSNLAGSNSSYFAKVK